jgi:hypothetical protein
MRLVHAQFRVGDLTFTAQDGIGECRGCSNSFMLPGADVGCPPITISGDKTDYKTNAPAIFGRVDYEDENGRGYWTTLCQYSRLHFRGWRLARRAIPPEINKKRAVSDWPACGSWARPKRLALKQPAIQDGNSPSLWPLYVAKGG